MISKAFSIEELFIRDYKYLFCILTVLFYKLCVLKQASKIYTKNYVQK